MHAESGGIRIWCGTDDAPAPQGMVTYTSEVVVMVGVAPADPGNRVALRWRVGEGAEQTAAAQWACTEPDGRVEYFRAVLSGLQPGDRVTYTAVCERAEGQGPSPTDPADHAQVFVLAADTSQDPPPAPRLADLPLGGDAAARDAVLHRLAERGVHTVDDLRDAPAADLTEAGAETRKGSRKVSAKDARHAAQEAAVLRSLRSYTELLPLAGDLGRTAALLESGFGDAAVIARKSRAEFISAAPDGIDEERATAIHAGAIAQTAFLDQVGLADEVDAQGTGGASCGCRECETAVSPLAYLANLLDYCLQHLRLKGAPLDLDWFIRSMHQPFHLLPATCAAQQEEVRHVRVCAEVLRDYVRTTRTPAPAEQQRLDARLHAYRQRCYALLLRELGTNYGELRAASTASDPVDRAAYANRLAIDSTDDGSPTLPRLVLDVSRGATGAQALTEANLEAVFGLRDTAREPTTSPDEPLLQVWRRKRLRRLWFEEDHPTDPYAERRLPVIDPDVIDPRDMRAGFKDGVRLWEFRRTWVDARLAAFAPLYDETAKTADFAAMIAAMTAPTTYRAVELTSWTKQAAARLPGLRTELTDPAKRRAAMDFLAADLALDEDAYLAFMAFMDRAADQTLLLPEEFADASAILVQATKRRFFPSWIAEEPQRDVIGLDLRLFCLAPHTPVPRRWLARPEDREQWRAALRRGGTSPVVDPDLIGPADLRDPVQGQAAYDLWVARRDHVRTALRHYEENLGRTLGDFDQALLQRTGIDGETLERLAQTRGKGESVAGILEMHALTGAELDELARARRQLRQGTALFDADWSAVFSILVQTDKRRRASLWRREERASGICASPDVFVLPVEPELPAAQGTPTDLLPAWRASIQDRQAWEDRLRRRMDDDESVGRTLRTVADTVEGECLPALRESLVDAAVPEPWGTDRKAKWLGDRLLIDLASGACQRTTRAAQAIESCRMLLFSVRSGRLSATHPDLALAADDFDAEMKWLGSYATWRSAMFVSLYPDIVPLPSLRRSGTTTTAFARLVRDVRAAPAFGPDGARRIARRYADYFRDVCSLTPQATCHVPGSLHLFARSDSGGIYWSQRNAHGPQAGEQSLWQRVPADAPPQVRQIVGAVPYVSEAEGHLVHLFALLHHEGSVRLAVSRYNTDRPHDGWSAFTPLDLPTGLRVEDAVVASRWPEPPTLILRLSDHQLHPVRLTEDGSGLASGDWDWNGAHAVRLRAQLKAGTGAEGPVPLALVDTDYGYGLFCRDGENGYAHFFNFPPEYAPGTLPLGRVATWQGALSLDTPGGAPPTWGGIGSNRVFACWSDGAGTYLQAFGVAYDGRRCQAYPRRTGFLGPDETLAAHSAGSDPRERESGLKAAVLHARLPSPARWLVTDLQRPGGGDVIQPSTVRIAVAPRATATVLVDLSDQVSSFDLQQRAVAVEQALADNADGPRSHRTYFEEAHHFVPMHLGLQLIPRGHFQAALDWMRTVYDYSAPQGQRRKIWYGLVEEESLPELWQRPPDWLLDPLNPHAIAATRKNAYTRFDVASIARCKLEYAHAEFTRDTSESLPHARTLYASAIELLDSADLAQRWGECTDVIGRLDIPVGTLQQRLELARLKQELRLVRNRRLIERTVAAAERVLRTETDEQAQLAQLHQLRRRLTGAPGEAGTRVRTVADVVTRARAATDRHRATLLDRPGLGRAAASVAAAAAAAPPRAVAGPAAAASLHRTFSFCIPANPVTARLRLSAELNLHKLRTCRNIAGLERAVEIYAAPTDAFSDMPSIGAGGLMVASSDTGLLPTSHRSAFLLQRAKELAHLAGQVEASFLQTLERKDFERYELLRARQDVALARSQMKLQDLRVVEAQDGVELAKLQQQRAQLQADHWTELLEAGESQMEQMVIDLMQAVELVHYGAGALSAAAAVAGFATGEPAHGLSSLASAASSAAAGLSTRANFLSILAAQERRRQDWLLQQSTALADVSIGAQAIRLADDHVRIVDQERTIASIQAQHTEDIVEFLATKFTNAELYDWMGSVLEPILVSLLQQGAATGGQLVRQMAFELQQAIPVRIQPDYWSAPAQDTLAGDDEGAPPDRRGLTGSIRLLADLSRLEQYALESARRPHHLTEVISLAHHDPYAFQRFRESGVLRFTTPMSMFDERFPGHYLRLVKRVRTTVVALIPPTAGIRATLSTTGRSSVVVGGDVFRTVTINRPASVALTAATDATGVFALDPTPELLGPCEGIGVATGWELRMPKAANPFDYHRHLADVLFTIEYTAFDSADYRQEVLRRLPGTRTLVRAFSLRREFVDAWYDLHHADPEASSFGVSFTTQRGDFPSHLEQLAVAEAALVVGRRAAGQWEVEVADLVLRSESGVVRSGGPATTVGGVIGADRGNAPNWRGRLGGDHPPVGTWTLTFPAAMRERFEQASIDDLVLLVTFRGRVPQWPQ
ncbi:hypothetical protein OIA45_40765 (plasmid) [Streptomyces chartreusis]|uniref:Tc toxin subunit A-related protein n=1 Tax=Streptomyces chartreusis TaxID=1969 RepID=UPI002F90E461|nr:hypothetical protein OIA45_40765 [Streptomyces chartreusis]